MGFNSILLSFRIASLAAYMKIGMENAKNGTVGQKYTPTAKVMEFNITNKSVGELHNEN